MIPEIILATITLEYCKEKESLSSLNYPTPDSSVEKYRLGGNSQQSNSLEAMARRGELSQQTLGKSNTIGKNPELWGTPRSSMANKPTKKQINMGSPKKKREDMVALWATPIQTDSKNVPYQMSKGKKITRLMGQAEGRLNPNWVEQLMGLKVGWTQLPIEWID